MMNERAYEVSLQTLEPFHIGGVGEPLSGKDNPIAVVGGKVAVPGSSLKGALRSQIEQYLINQFYDQAKSQWKPDQRPLQPCMAATAVSVDEAELISKGLYRNDKPRPAPGCHYPCEINTKDDRGREHRGKCGDTPHSICPACYLLGAQGLNGFIRVPFLFSDASQGSLYSARMDRATRTVAERTNRPYQLLPDGVEFKGIMYITFQDDVLGWTLGKARPLKDKTTGDLWLSGKPWSEQEIVQKLVVDRLQAINILGGYKSKGFGRVKITVTEKKT